MYTKTDEYSVFVKSDEYASYAKTSLSGEYQRTRITTSTRDQLSALTTIRFTHRYERDIRVHDVHGAGNRCVWLDMDDCVESSNSQLHEDAGTARQRSEANEYHEWAAAWARTDRSVR
ncbi:hypothetical protein JG687_00018045 [Phytophthora cactorum]|uniref:Uncharacterized protein n=1 Tax=Phytophthora cactorum TaxID=29920 RepID=A0A8T1TNS7_9STRA|nr:hypothetical protein JG687_00018045 [Phytophthora cactorum]